MHIKQTSKKELRDFGLLVGSVFIVLGIFFLKKISAQCITAGGILIIAGVLYPQLLKPVYEVWMKIGHGMGWVMTRIILFTVFILVFTPMRFLLQLTGKKLLDTTIKKRAKSYWIPRQSSKEYGTMLEKQF